MPFYFAFSSPGGTSLCLLFPELFPSEISYSTPAVPLLHLASLLHQVYHYYVFQKVFPRRDHALDIFVYRLWYTTVAIYLIVPCLDTLIQRMEMTGSTLTISHDSRRLPTGTLLLLEIRFSGLLRLLLGVDLGVSLIFPHSEPVLILLLAVQTPKDQLPPSKNRNDYLSFAP